MIYPLFFDVVWAIGGGKECFYAFIALKEITGELVFLQKIGNE